MIYDFNEDVDNFLYNPTVGSGSAQINLIGMGSGSESPSQTYRDGTSLPLLLAC